MHRTFLTTLTVLVAAAAVIVGGASTAQATAKPGFEPGVWRGTATLFSKSTDGPMSTTFSGKVKFTLTVKRNLAAGGTGTAVMTMNGTGPVDGKMNGKATFTFTGTGSDVRYAGSQVVSGTVSDGTISRPIGFTLKVNGRLVITKAGSCRVVGSTQGKHLNFKWTATKGTGTCL
jgi:hypothetical protein